MALPSVLPLRTVCSMLVLIKECTAPYSLICPLNDHRSAEVFRTWRMFPRTWIPGGESYGVRCFDAIPKPSFRIPTHLVFYR